MEDLFLDRRRLITIIEMTSFNINFLDHVAIRVKDMEATCHLVGSISGPSESQGVGRGQRLKPQPSPEVYLLSQKGATLRHVQRGLPQVLPKQTAGPIDGRGQRPGRPGGDAGD